ncbi:uncharacterized protein [Macrobrachium rosenbergii]|uniref:uncharacterized protein n=1 Tax=Macrobrachium rosenbergii TaxID=79674 RepID=UPI0034D6FA56
MDRRISPVTRKNVFHLLLFKDHLLLLSGMLLLSFCPVSSANPPEQGCHEEQIGVWTGDMPYKSGMNVSIDGGRDSWSNVVLELRETGGTKGKVLLRRYGDDLSVTGIGISFQITETLQDFLWNSNRLTLNFKMTKDVNRMMVWNGTSSFPLGFSSISASIDSLRIYSNKTSYTYSKTVISICNSDTVTGTSEERCEPKTESPPAATCPTPEEKICPLCPEPSCPSAPPCPAITACPLQEPCPVPTPCPSITATYQGKPDENKGLHDSITNNMLNQEESSQTVIFLEGWDRWIMYGLAAGCTAFLLMSVALAIALCKVRRRCAKSGMSEPTYSANFPLQLGQMTDRNDLGNISGTTAGLVNDNNQQPNHNNVCTEFTLPIPGNQPPNAEVTDDDFDSDPEEWDNQEPLYTNIGCFSENLPPAYNEYQHEQDEN